MKMRILRRSAEPCGFDVSSSSSFSFESLFLFLRRSIPESTPPRRRHHHHHHHHHHHRSLHHLLSSKQQRKTHRVFLNSQKEESAEAKKTAFPSKPRLLTTKTTTRKTASLSTFATKCSSALKVKVEVKEEEEEEEKEEGSTIYAISTPPGRGGVAVLRISGPKSWEVGERLTLTGLLKEKRGRLEDVDEYISSTRKRRKKRREMARPGVLRRAQFVFETRERELEEMDELELEDDDDEFDKVEGGKGQGRRRENQAPAVARRKEKNTIGVIDEGLIVFFEAPRSFTGEDVCELHMHGSIAVCKKVLEVLATMSAVDEKDDGKNSPTLLSFRNLRPAEPGEFSKRAFLNKKMNLVQAESLADLIESETEAQRALAVSEIELGSADGDVSYRRAPTASSLSRKVDEWTNVLTKALAVCEAVLDFPGEDPKLESSLIHRDVLPAICRVKGEIDAALKDAEARELVRTGVRVCIVGATNAGKSTLLNYFAKRNVAIVSKVPGTTRDVVEVSLELDGRKVVIFDTAGHRFLPIAGKTSSTSEIMEECYDAGDEDESLFDDEYERRVGKLSDDTKDLIDEIEREGIERGKNVAKMADIIIEMIDATNPKRIDFANMNIKRADGIKIISVVNKCDALYVLEEEEEEEEEEVYSRYDRSLLRLSLRTGQGLEALTKAVSNAVQECTITASSSSSQASDGATAAIARSRHRAHARAISNSLGACLSELNKETTSDDNVKKTTEDEGSKCSLNHSLGHVRTELVAEDLREALGNCSRVVGRLDVTENVLDVLFSEFCIGK